MKNKNKLRIKTFVFKIAQNCQKLLHLMHGLEVLLEASVLTLLYIDATPLNPPVLT